MWRALFHQSMTNIFYCLFCYVVHTCIKNTFYLVRETPCMIYWRIFLLQGYAKIIVDLRWEMEAHLRPKKNYKKIGNFFKCTANTSLEKHIDSTYVAHNFVIAKKWWLGHNDNILCLEWLNDLDLKMEMWNIVAQLVLDMGHMGVALNCSGL